MYSIDDLDVSKCWYGFSYLRNDSNYPVERISKDATLDGLEVIGKAAPYVMKAEPGHSDILILRRTQGECSFQFDFRLIPRKWTEAEMIEEGKKELQDYAGMCYSTKWLDSGVVIYFKS